MDMNRLPSTNQYSGFGIIEVLITVTILSVGLLAIAGMQVKSIKHNQDTAKSARAAMLADDLANRLRVNAKDSRLWAGSQYTSINNAAENPSCQNAASACTPAQMAQRDLYEWKQAIEEPQTGLPSGSGTISYSANSVYNITLNWQDRDGTARSFTTSVQP